MPIDETHDPARTSWIESARQHPTFPIQNLPYGIFSSSDGASRPGVAIGEHILDLKAIADLLPHAVGEAVRDVSLNKLLALSETERVALRRRLSSLLSDKANRGTVEGFLFEASQCVLHLPARIGDYSDFYTGLHHASNLGRQFRPANPLLPNYKWIPLGYHGRASSVRISGIPVTRPVGQLKAADEAAPVLAPTRRLDYELEVGVWIGQGNDLGTPISILDAPKHVAGLCLLNDWSARDIQLWEYQPLGPFLSKSFQTTISPWVVTMEALTPFRVGQAPRPEGDPRPLPYLWDEGDQDTGAVEIELTIHLSTALMRARGDASQRLSRGSTRHMYWTIAQMVAHQSSNGCNLNPGDLLGTGTLSAPDADGFGSLIEITSGGSQPILLSTGETRTFLEDGDEISLSGIASRDGFKSIGFGECVGRVAPARSC